tara:strand:- start:3059 stop:3364 length:306 start_codon:yes stop_codon:yes gene_type:complete
MKENKLIAEFMGLGDGDKYFSPTLEDAESVGLGMHVYPDEMRYHTSWDWLMPVVEKIENDGLDPHGMIDNSLRKNNQKRWRSIEDLHNVAVYLINIYNNER